jgi:hypothetical protein
MVKEEVEFWLWVFWCMGGDVGLTEILRYLLGGVWITNSRRRRWRIFA